MWTDYLDNAQALRGVFGDNVPELRGVELVQLILDPAGTIRLTLDIGRIPDEAPKKWKDRGFDKLQLRMWFFIGALAIRRDDVGEEWNVTVALEDKRLHIISENEAFELTASFDHSRIEFQPYRAKDHELPPKWYSSKPLNSEIWIDHLGNDQTARDAFGENIPALRNLGLTQLVLDSTGHLALILDLGGFPLQYPSKWKDEGCNTLQLLMSCNVGALTIRRDDVLGKWKVSAEWAGKQLHVLSEDGTFELAARYDAAKIYFYPNWDEFIAIAEKRQHDHPPR